MKTLVLLICLILCWSLLRFATAEGVPSTSERPPGEDAPEPAQTKP